MSGPRETVMLVWANLPLTLAGLATHTYLGIAGTAACTVCMHPTSHTALLSCSRHLHRLGARICLLDRIHPPRAPALSQPLLCPPPTYLHTAYAHTAATLGVAPPQPRSLAT
ncbi:hypothetical protein GGS23DRAFT_581146 [Durotheca rogersii]|uniref:uncharacterized protein n=1 Tax=Durotheca rogersii TaxID=419775 RepID=UPI00221FAD59|nr:uncharacterized protein GGS23DRAFT_581146 [Durotheca rogersii]KAI5860370.1 hypothetical protein GGS23DRAFT_581146 [Durotheca rogersii]